RRPQPRASHGGRRRRRRVKTFQGFSLGAGLLRIVATLFLTGCPMRSGNAMTVTMTGDPAKVRNVASV
ncbi:MAG: hypothetical protein M3008_02360, partial [Chloroflexota bacterium]|nr:hypothetical protein [Chloroflexota bacterium]